MNKRVLSLLLSVLLTVSMIPAFAITSSADTHSGTVNDITWTLDESTGVLELTGTGSTGEYLIPHNPPSWYGYRHSVTSIVIGEGITGIGKEAFSGYADNYDILTSVYIPKSVTSIGYMAFYMCPGITDVYYGGSHYQWAQIDIDEYNTSLTGATIHFTEEPHTHVFSYVQTPPTCTEQGYTTYTCTICGYQMVSNYKEPRGHSWYVTDFIDGDPAMFAKRCSACGMTEESPTIGKTEGSITWELVAETGVLTLSGTGSTGEYLIPHAAPSWYGYRHYVTSIVIGDGITGIGKEAFSGYADNYDILTSVYIPESVTSIGYMAFYMCPAITDVYYGGTRSQWNRIDIDDYNTSLTGAAIHVIEEPIALAKVNAYDVKLLNLDPESSYVIRYATGEYGSVTEVKNGANAGFIQITGADEALISLPTHGVHTVAAVCGGETAFLGTVEIIEEDMQNELAITASDLSVRVENLYGAYQVRLIENGSVLVKVNASQFLSDGLKYSAELTAPASGTYTVTVLFENGERLSESVTLTAPEAAVAANGRVFTVSDFGGAGSVSYMRLAKGVYSTAAAIKAAEDLRTYGGARYFTDETASFAALDAVSGETNTYTVQIGYVSGYSEFITFELTPTVPVITTSAGTITIENAQTEDYYIDWVRCAPGVLDSLYAVRHAEGTRVRKTAHIVNGQLSFTGLASGTYTLYYLYDANNLSEGLITVIVD